MTWRYEWMEPDNHPGDRDRWLWLAIEAFGPVRTDADVVRAMSHLEAAAKGRNRNAARELIAVLAWRPETMRNTAMDAWAVSRSGAHVRVGGDLTMTVEYGECTLTVPDGGGWSRHVVFQTCLDVNEHYHREPPWLDRAKHRADVFLRFIGVDVGRMWPEHGMATPKPCRWVKATRGTEP